MQLWQMNMLKKLEKFKPGEMMVQFTGRQAGKSFWSGQAVDRLMQDLMNRPVEDLVLSEGRVLGSRYHCVEPIGGNWREMESWAVRTYGEAGSVWQADRWVDEPAQRWYMNDRRFWFRNERDRTLFILKWR